jgi:hypothetical protein
MTGVYDLLKKKSFAPLRLCEMTSLIKNRMTGNGAMIFV